MVVWRHVSVGGIDWQRFELGDGMGHRVEDRSTKRENLNESPSKAVKRNTKGGLSPKGKFTLMRGVIERFLWVGGDWVRDELIVAEWFKAYTHKKKSFGSQQGYVASNQVNGRMDEAEGKEEKKRAHLDIFIGRESPAQLRCESGFAHPPLAAQHEDLPFDPCQPLVDHREC